MTLKKQSINNKLIKLVSVLTLWLLNTHCYANERLTSNKLNEQSAPFLMVNPERCVALHAGQTCYQNVVFKWRTISVGNYCLFLEKAATPLKCWNEVSSGSLKMDFQSIESKTVYLRMKQSNINIADTELIVAWVYGNKKRRRASWRLF
jgi:hypothetical protein